MRQIFAKTLLEVARQDERIVLLTADLGFMVWEPFIQEFPDRYFNVGVAEQNMIGIATGLAKAGFIPFTYSIVPFSVLRCYEFIRNGPVLHHLPVRMIGMGAGFDYGNAGHTHHGLEDLCVMRVQPNMTLISPADDTQTRNALRETYNIPGPVYYRLSKNSSVIPELQGRFRLGKLEKIREGRDVLCITTGSIAKNVLIASALLEEQGIGCGVAILSSITQGIEAEIAKLIASSQYSCLVTVEAHYKSGGLGSLVAEVIADRGRACRMLRFGVLPRINSHTGSENYYHRENGLDPESLALRISTELKPRIKKSGLSTDFYHLANP